MEYKNYWEIEEDTLNDLIYTNNIYEIMEEQCKYLFQITNGEIFAVFDEIKIDGSISAITKHMSNLLKSIADMSYIHETVAESSTKNLVDANAMYYNKCYGFEICTSRYRFRVFELKITPLYPVEMIIDEGICSNIGNKLATIAISMSKSNHFTINNEDIFCQVLQVVLQDKKVRYIIHELQKRIQEQKEIVNCVPEKIIICEGQTDEIILQAIAHKLNRKVIFVVANGKHHVPMIFDTIKGKHSKSNILIVVDSDGDEEGTKKSIDEIINDADYEIAIINNCIEDWFMPEIADFSRLKLIQTIDAIIEKTNFEELCQKHKSFAKVVEFIQK